MLPFTQAQFFAVFTAYNAALWPVSLAFYGLAAVALASLRPRGLILVLAAMWAWTGIAYHAVFFAPINPAAYLFAVLFVAEAGLLLREAARGDEGRPAPAHWVSVIGILLIAYAMAAYPLLGLAFGHAYGDLPQFGVTPCPVTIFTLGCFLLRYRRPRWLLLVIPLIWSLVGGSAAILLAVPQDWPLLASGVGTAIAWFVAARSSQSAP